MAGRPEGVNDPTAVDFRPDFHLKETRMAVMSGTAPRFAENTAPRRTRSPYPAWFYVPAAVIYGVLFLLPTFSSVYFSLTRWTLFDSTFIGLENFAQFFREPFLIKALVNTVIFAVATSGSKVVLGLLLAVLLTSNVVARGFLRSVVFFPVLVSTVGVGITFMVMMHPTQGVINEALALFGIKGPGWLTNPSLAIFSVAIVDVWKGVGLATVIFIAGIASIPGEYYDAAHVDGATPLQSFLNITLPLCRPATVTVIILSFIGGLRTFDLIWTMTRGGPGFSSDVIASVIYKQYQAGFYGLSTAGNVVLFILIALLVVPLSMYLNRKEGHE
jgi:raffinose/stachyose/melibiose transport system permease protein